MSKTKEEMLNEYRSILLDYAVWKQNYESWIKLEFADFAFRVRCVLAAERLKERIGKVVSHIRELYGWRKSGEEEK